MPRPAAPGRSPGWPGLVVVALCGLAGCGPTRVEAAQLVLFSALPVTLVGLGLQTLYGQLWARVRPVTRLDRRGVRDALIAAGLLTLVPLTRLHSGVLDELADLLTIAIWAVGCSYLSILAVILRVGVALDRPGFTRRAPLLAWIVPAAPALVFALVGSITDKLGFEEVLYLGPGYAGWITGPVVVVLVAEPLIRTWRARRG